MISCKLEAKIETGEIISLSNLPGMNSFVFSSLWTCRRALSTHVRGACLPEHPMKTNEFQLKPSWTEVSANHCAHWKPSTLTASFKTLAEVWWFWRGLESPEIWVLSAMLMGTAQEAWHGPPWKWEFSITEPSAKKCCEQTMQPALERYESKPKAGMGSLQLPPVHQLYLNLHLNYAAHPTLSQKYRTSYVNQKGVFLQSVFDLFWVSRWIQCSHLLWGNSEHIPAEQQWVQAPSHVMQLMALTCSTCLSAWQRLRLEHERVSVHKGLLKMRLGLSSQAKPSHIIRGMRKVMPTSRSRFQHTDPFSWPPKMQNSVQFGVYLYENSLHFCSMPWGCANYDRRGIFPAAISSGQGAAFCPASVITPFPTWTEQIKISKTLKN